MYLVLCLMMVMVDDCLSSLDCVIQTERRMTDTQDVQCSCQDGYGDQDIFMVGDGVKCLSIPNLLLQWADMDDLRQT